MAAVESLKSAFPVLSPLYRIAVLDAVFYSHRAFLPTISFEALSGHLDLECQVPVVVHVEVLDRADAIFIGDVSDAAGEEVRAAAGVQQADACVPVDQVVEAFECNAVDLFRISILDKDKIAIVLLEENERFVLTKD